MVISSFLGPFLLNFIIWMVILDMQFLWLYIDDLMGKGLEWNIILELLIYASANWVPLALPLSVLLASIMSFGSLGEKKELLAMKASGISLFKIMKPLMVVILFNCLTTASGLSEWFCDDVNLKDDKFTFFWDGSEETATLKNVKKGESVKFQWDDDEGEDYYFEMAIRIDDLTKEVALIVTDFHEDDEDELRLLWDNNIHKLKQAIGG